MFTIQFTDKAFHRFNKQRFSWQYAAKSDYHDVEITELINDEIHVMARFNNVLGVLDYDILDELETDEAKLQWLLDNRGVPHVHLELDNDCTTIQTGEGGHHIELSDSLGQSQGLTALLRVIGIDYEFV